MTDTHTSPVTAEQLAALVTYLENQSNRLTKSLDNPSWMPRRSHVEGARNAFLTAANTLEQALRRRPAQQTLTTSEIHKEVQDAYANGFADGKLAHNSPPALPSAPSVPAPTLTMIAAKAREWAGHYDPHSDGRNTFVLFAEWVEGLSVPSAPSAPGGQPNPQRIEVDIGAAAAALQANPELCAMMNEMVGGPALVEAQDEIDRLRNAIRDLHRVYWTGVDVDKDAVSVACLHLFASTLTSTVSHDIEKTEGGVA